MKKLRFRSILLFFILILNLSLVAGRAFEPAIPNATIAVTTTVDQFGEDLDHCSLREAVQATNIHDTFGSCPAGEDIDVITLPAGIYHLTRDAGSAATFEDINEYGDLDIRVAEEPGVYAILSPDRDYTVTLAGAGQGLTMINGSGIDRVIDVSRGRKCPIST